jgi:hypothetical protein
MVGGAVGFSVAIPLAAGVLFLKASREERR